MKGLDRSRPPAPGPLRPLRFPRVGRSRLRSGVPVLTARAGDLPLVTVQLVLDAGSAHDPSGRAGLAHLTAGLLESGTSRRTAEEIALRVDELGIVLDVGTSWDAVTLGFTGLRSRMEEGFSLLADLVRAPSFPPPEVERLKQEKLGTVQQRRADPGSLAAEVLHLRVFPEGSPYALPLAGTTESITGLDREQVAQFHGSRYGPRVTTLVAAGEVEAQEVVEMADRHLGDWTSRADPVPLPAAEPRGGRTRIVVVHRPGAVQSEIRLGHPGVERTASDYPAVQVMNGILGGTFASRLNLNLRERLGYTYGATSSWSARRVAGMFTMSAAVQLEATAHSVAEMLREMRQMQDAPPTEAEVRDARSYYAGVLPLTVETTSGVAARLAALATFGLADDYWERYPRELLAVTPSAAHDAAQRRLQPDRAVVAISADAPRVVKALEALEEGPVEVVVPEEILR